MNGSTSHRITPRTLNPRTLATATRAAELTPPTIRRSAPFLFAALAIGISLPLPASPPPVASPACAPVPQAGQDLRTILSGFNGYDRDRDGIREINSLAPVAFETRPTLVPGSTTRLLLVLIEHRLMNSIAGTFSVGDLTDRLRDYRRHLERDGFVPYFVDADVYAGSQHQDGLTLLAMRDVFLQVRARAPAFQGAVLIGSFPEAMLVRRWVWRQSGSIQIRGATYSNTSWLRIVPELIASRSDIVLSDLDGNWSQLYHRNAFQTESLVAIPNANSPSNWPQPGQMLICSTFERSQPTYQDCFYIDDANAAYGPVGSSLAVTANPAPLRPEVGGLDRYAPNPIARPDIMISRINPRHVGVVQNPLHLDTQGRPKTVASTTSPDNAYVRDPAMERRLLIEYLDRNLAHRVGARKASGQRTARLRSKRSNDKSHLADGRVALGPVVDFDDATVPDLVRFLATPAVVKTIAAHSAWNESQIFGTYAMTELDAVTGGCYWHWKLSGAQYVPTYDDNTTRERLGFPLLRTLWTNKKLAASGPTFYLHVGCNANDVTQPRKSTLSTTPSVNVPYSHSAYAGHVQLTENVLFYANGLAVLARAKEFNDVPSGFAGAFGAANGRFGDTLKEYARRDSLDGTLGCANYDRTYFWSILGDWTLRLDHTLRPTESVAILHTHAGFQGHSIALPVGRYDVSLLQHSIGNDALSSVTVSPGFRVRLFQHDRFRSEGMAITSSTSTLGAMNDQTSSLIIEPVNQGGVRLFQHSGFSGPSVALDIGVYDVNTLVNTIGNDTLSSITVQPGYIAYLFYHAGFNGGPLTVTGSLGSLGSWNDIVSSLVVFRIY
ncbi:MAG: hypothetical protein H6832_03130 [Planctomycetes bacterium]|nr:hypothetical protein [Planctomycetota bacterium]